MKFILSMILLFTTVSAWSYELLMIQAISTSKKSFVTRRGKRDGVVEGVTGTFTSDNTSFIAKAKTVTGEYTHWELVNPDAMIPFNKGQIITYHPAEEYVWTLMAEEKRKSILDKKFTDPRKSVLIKTAITRGLSESTSDTQPGNSRRGGVLFETLYEKEIFEDVAFDIGLRYEKEIIQVPAASLTTQRALVVGDALYYIPGLEDLIKARIYLGLGVGYGQSSTSMPGATQSGIAKLLPTAKLGGSLPFNKSYHMIFEGAFETIQTEEKLPIGGTQTTNQSNLRLGIGIRKCFF